MKLSTTRRRPRRRRAVAVLLPAVGMLVAGSLAACAGTTAPPQATAAASAPEVQAGTWLRSYAGTTVEGKPFSGASLAGKPTVLWFWAPWCPTCLQQAPGVRAALERSSATVNFLGVAGLDTTANMPAFVKLAKIESMTSVADPQGVIWKQFKITEQSYFVVLDASGTEVYRGRLQADDIPAKIAALTA
jgi:thiol-disulfide isomerase/thioredoxin